MNLKRRLLISLAVEIVLRRAADVGFTGPNLPGHREAIELRRIRAKLGGSDRLAPKSGHCLR